MNIRIFKKLKAGDQIIHNILGTNYTVSRIEENRVFAIPLYYDFETTIEDGERSFFDLIANK